MPLGSERATEPTGSQPVSGDLLLFGLRLDRLTLRLTVGIAALVLVPLGLGFWALSRHHYERSVAAQVRAAQTQARMVETALRHQMIKKDLTVITSILTEIGARGDMRRAMIINHEGEVRISSDPRTVGQVFPRESPTCFVCHALHPDERSRWVVLQEPDGEVLRTVLPIENRTECQVCHDKANRLNGILICDTSLAPLRAELAADTRSFLAGTIGLAVLLLGGVGLFVRRLILTRLARLQSAVRSIAEGDLDQRVAVRGDDLLASLSSDFNSMAQTISSLLGEVRERQAQLASIMNSLDDGMVVLDRDARVVAANLSFCRRVGTHADQLRGHRCHDGSGHALPCCGGDGECPAAKCQLTGELQRGVFRRSASEGRHAAVEEVHASPVFNERGEVVQVVEIWRDITARVQEEERLAEIEHLVSLGTLASGFSHEVNTPLASMLTSAESMLGRIDEAGCDQRATPEFVAGLRECAVTIREQVLRCGRITQQFLRFSRGIPPSVEPLDLRQVVEGVVVLVQPTAREARVELIVACDGALPAVRANAEVVQHALLNLLVNAIQSFERRGGAIHVRVAFDEQVSIRVRDEGCGIPQEAQAHLFEPFRSRKAGGTGLGLFLSRTFLRRFGGDVHLVDSEVGRGSCFEIAFAPAPEAAA
jgi:PAS domain S-box-containing protein